MKKYILMSTDGYSIETAPYDSLEEAKENMYKAYEMLNPKENDESSIEMSELGETSAILYANGENVYVWDIVTVTMNNTREKELLNAVIDHIAAAENTSTTIETLLNMGFTKEELINEYSFCESDVEEVISEQEGEQDYE